MIRWAAGGTLLLLGLALLAYVALASDALQGLPSDHGPGPTGPVGNREYRVPDGAIMSLSAPAMGIRDAPVFEGAGPVALARGVGHMQGTSVPWSDTAERNVYLAGHRHGWPGTRGRLIFYELDELRRGDRVVLASDGRSWEYRVTEGFVVGPDERWVTGRVPGRDMVTLQTCTLPDLDERLIVRAERV